MIVIWTPEAEQDRLVVWEYIAADNVTAADQMDALLSEAAMALEVHPLIGRTGRRTGTRELVIHENYLMIYEIQQDTTWILAVVHVARRWPPL